MINYVYLKQNIEVLFLTRYAITRGICGVNFALSIENHFHGRGFESPLLPFYILLCFSFEYTAIQKVDF